MDFRGKGFKLRLWFKVIWAEVRIALITQFNYCTNSIIVIGNNTFKKAKFLL